MKPCIIKQPAGIGDVFFCQKIAHYMVHHGFDVIWPLRPDIAWIGDYIKGYGISFPTLEDDFPGKDIYDTAAGWVIEDKGAFICPATADLTHNDGKTMSSKLTMLGMEYEDWRDYFLFKRNLDKEDDLYYNVLGLKDDSEYVFIRTSTTLTLEIVNLFLRINLIYQLWSYKFLMDLHYLIGVRYWKRQRRSIPLILPSIILLMYLTLPMMSM